MRKLLYVPLAVGIFMLSCTQPTKDNSDKIRDKLFQDVCTLTKAYTDSLTGVTDSVTAERILSKFESKLQNLYMHYPPAADRLLQEDHNDSIYELTKKFREAYQKSLCPEDTLMRDSLYVGSLPKWALVDK